MSFDPDKHKRQSRRLKGYDYSQVGAYFVTICTQHRACLFAEVADGDVVLNEAGAMVGSWWQRMSDKFLTVDTDAFVIMPDHIHGVVVITSPVGATLCGRPSASIPHGRPDEWPTRVLCEGTDEKEQGHPHGGAPTIDGVEREVLSVGVPVLGDVMGWFKTMTTNAYIRGVKQSGWTPFDQRLWQLNYYEHVIRHDEDLNRIRDYIWRNPSRWSGNR